SIQGSRCLVAGYGTCGAVLAHKLGQWKAQVTVMERKKKKRDIARSYGFDAVSFDDDKNHMGNYDVIFNTVPAHVLTEKLLKKVKQEVTIIDIASRPGGVDFEFCQKRGIHAKLCLGLPGKYAPKSAAGILMEVIKKTILGD
ncbi:MAG: NAD(P)-dependent oxidoreductase, partial [Clostridiales bacterium]|nr:NAD(P)-dependent oxidoreductase [Clostridiales bacterium]